MFKGNDYWKNYMTLWFGKELIEDWKQNCKVVRIESNGEDINLECYIVSDTAPTLIFSHGIAGYARILLPFVMPLFKNGINIICPDLKGYGYNSHIKGDFTWNQHVQNIVDTASYAKNISKGSLYIGGASMGGPLAYEAASKVKNVSGLICWCLWNLSDKEFIENETVLGKKTFALLPLLKIISRIFGSFRIKTYNAVSYDTLTDSKVFNDMVKLDPQAGTLISLRGMISLLTQSSPTLLYNKYKIPTLVLQPSNDKMTPVKYIKKTYNDLGSEIKKYIEVENSPHFPLDKKFYDIWATEVTSFIR